MPPERRGQFFSRRGQPFSRRGQLFSRRERPQSVGGNPFRVGGNLFRAGGNLFRAGGIPIPILNKNITQEITLCQDRVIENAKKRERNAKMREIFVSHLIFLRTALASQPLFIKFPLVANEINKRALMPLFFVQLYQKNKGIRARFVALSATKGNVINKGFNNKICRCGVI
jgi:hypothetical protein